MKSPLITIFLALFLITRAAFTQEMEDPAISTSSAWIAFIHCAPGAGVVQMKLGDEFQVDIAPGRKVGPVALRPGDIKLHLTLGEKSSTTIIGLKPDQKLVAAVVKDPPDGLAVKTLPLPAGEGKRRVMRLPGTGDKVWKIGKKELPVSTLIPFSGDLSVKDANGKVMKEANSEEPGIYLLAPSADEGEIEIIFMP